MTIASPWRKSSRSTGEGGNCVEARKTESFQIRDSKLGDASPTLSMAADDFAGLLASVTHKP
ncbi:MAG: DUF397 domain-containing protein [Stackebrandtia sp.]